MIKTTAGKTVLAALIAELWLPMGASAQNTDETAAPAVPQQVVVSGIRASLMSSLATKRLQEGVVDAVSAEDAGKFPDTNIAESLQRVTGVQIQRNSGEGRYISVRGLGPEFNNVLVNGRTMTSDTGGREFSFDLLSSDLISKAIVYKTSQPFLPEGGIGSTVDIQTARPLSGKAGHSGVISVSGSYDSESTKKTPNISGMYSFANAARTFGVVGSLSYTDRASKQISAVNDAWNYRDLAMINGDLNSKGLTAADVTHKTVYMPQSFGYQQEDETRKRLVGNFSVQFNPSADWKLTADALYSRLNQRNNVIAVSDWIIPQQVGVKLDSNNQVVSFMRPGMNFQLNNPALDRSNNSHDMIAKGADRLSITQALGLNSKWNLAPEWKLEGDLWHSRTTSDWPGMWAVAGMLPQNGDLLTFGATPTVTFGDSIADPTAVHAHSVSYSRNHSADQLHEGRVNLSWNHEIGYFKGINTGLSYSKRSFGGVNYGADSWNAFSGYHVPLPSSLFTVTPLGNVFGSGVEAPPSYLRFDPYAYMAYLNQPSLLPLTNNPAKYSDLSKFPNGPMAIDYTKPQTHDVTEKVSNLFLDSKWEGERWSGNVGVRMVHVSSVSTGASRALLSAEHNTTELIYYNLTYGDNVPTSVSNSYSNVLPSGNLKFDLTDDTVLRLGASRTLTRPPLSQMGVNNSYGNRYHDVQTGGGNPYLQSMLSNNYDVSYEWYLSKTNYVSAAAFMKNISNFLEQKRIDTTLPQFPGEVVHDTRIRNGQKGRIKGVELAGQYAFDNAIPLLQGFGVAANYTFVDAVAERNSNAGVATPTCAYPGLSKQSYNASLFFENSKFQARTSYNWRNHFTINCGGGSTQPRNRAAYGQIDGSLRYNLTPSISVYLDAINIRNDKAHEYANNENQFLSLEEVGRRYNFGVRMAF
jgi:TonB-dependent receptor